MPNGAAESTLLQKLDCWWHWKRCIRKSICDTGSLMTDKNLWARVGTQLDAMHNTTYPPFKHVLMNKFVAEWTIKQPVWITDYFLNMTASSLTQSLTQSLTHIN